MGLFSRLFQIYPEERKKTFFFSLLAIVWAFASTSANVLLDGLFLEKLGASYLPLSYILGAFFGCIVSFLMITSLKKINITALYLSVIGMDIIAYTALNILQLILSELPREIWFVYRVFAMTNYTILTTSFWSFADSFYDMQDVKRIYSLLFAAIFTGAIMGSFTVSSIIANFKPITIFSMVACLFFITGFLIIWISKCFHMVHDEMVETSSNPRGEGFFSMLKNLFSSKYAIYLTLYSFLAEVLWNITDFNYLYEFQTYFQHLNPTDFSNDPQLIEYIGLMRALASLINIFIGLFIFSKLVKRFGVTVMIFVPFILIGLLYLPWVGISNIAIASIAYLTIEGVQRAFGDNSFHLLVHGIAGKIRISYRIIIASLVEPIAMMTAGIFLQIPKTNSILIGLLITAIAIINCIRLKSEYLSAIFSNLQRNSLNLTKATFQRLYFSEKIKKTLLHKTKTADQKSIVFYLKCSLALHLNLTEELFKKLHLYPTKLQLEMLSALKPIPPQAAIDWIVKLHNQLEKPEQAITYFILARMKALDRKKALLLLNSGLLAEKKAAIYALCFSNRSNYKQAFQDRKMALEELRNLETSSDIEELSYAIEIKQLIEPDSIDFFFHFFNHENKKLSTKAIYAISQTVEKKQAFISKQIIKKMREPNSFSFRKHCIDALQKIYNPSMLLDLLQSSLHFQAKEKRYLLNMLASFPESIPSLFKVFVGNYPLQARKLAAHALYRLQPNLLLRHVESAIEKIMKSCHFNFYFFHTLDTEHSFRSLFLTSFYETLYFMIEILGLAGKIEDPQILVFSIRSDNEKTHAHAIETIEKTTPYTIFRYLEPLISDEPIADRIKRSLKLYPEFESMKIEDILELLSNSCQLIDQVAFALLAKKHKINDWKKEIFSRLKNSDISYHLFAMELLNR